ncbi:hypothetical protein ACQKD0_15345, partial [Vreelandella aquamarina]|uniref:hypothetical protein n=1 Tax=Vreelandella aquamarina TaxID=77097 RepID=UPI003D08E3DE
NGCLLKAEVFSTPSGEERQTPRHEYQTCSPPQEDYADDTPENGETLVATYLEFSPTATRARLIPAWF